MWKRLGAGNSAPFYYPGIGTYGYWFQEIKNAIVAPLDEDVRRVLDDAHNDFRAYEEGDRVVVFGFSRGAALARKFVSEILDDSEDESRKVAFLGVFDTVAEMGIRGVHLKGREIKAEDLDKSVTLNERVQRAVHIVALDEDRISYAPTLINKDKDGSPPNRILEVWFPGIHTDIGGGHRHDGLSDQTLAFMIEQCKVFMRDNIQIAAGDRESRESVEVLLKKLKESAPTQYQDHKSGRYCDSPYGGRHAPRKPGVAYGS